MIRTKCLSEVRRGQNRYQLIFPDSSADVKASTETTWCSPRRSQDAFFCLYTISGVAVYMLQLTAGVTANRKHMEMIENTAEQCNRSLGLSFAVDLPFNNLMLHCCPRALMWYTALYCNTNPGTEEEDGCVYVCMVNVLTVFLSQWGITGSMISAVCVWLLHCETCGAETFMRKHSAGLLWIPSTVVAEGKVAEQHRAVVRVMKLKQET